MFIFRGYNTRAHTQMRLQSARQNDMPSLKIFTDAAAAECAWFMVNVLLFFSSFFFLFSWGIVWFLLIFWCEILVGVARFMGACTCVCACRVHIFRLGISVHMYFRIHNLHVCLRQLRPPTRAPPPSPKQTMQRART